MLRLRNSSLPDLNECYSSSEVAPPPNSLISDNNPQFYRHKMKVFSLDTIRSHISSSPKYPQSNGEAQHALQTIKNLLKKSCDPYWALLTLNNASEQWLEPCRTARGTEDYSARGARLGYGCAYCLSCQRGCSKHFQTLKFFSRRRGRRAGQTQNASAEHTKNKTWVSCQQEEMSQFLTQMNQVLWNTQSIPRWYLVMATVSNTWL